jgi:alpha-beta hydrolase superfamily lysophospholipase
MSLHAIRLSRRRQWRLTRFSDFTHHHVMNIERREGQFKSRRYGRSNELFYQSWRTPQAHATLVITHGMSEHSDCYAQTANVLASSGYDVFAWDLRGHGRSEGKRGYVDRFDSFAFDLGEFLKYLRDEALLDKPFALIGHSLGGLITADHALHRDAETPQANALILSSPAFGLTMDVPVIKDLAAHVLRRIMPTLTLSSEIQYPYLSHDPEWQKFYRSDSLRHDKIAPALYLGMLETMATAQSEALNLQSPILIQAAGDDRIVSLNATRAFFSKIGSSNKRMLVYEKSFHEIYNDIERDQVFADMQAFLGGVIA